MLDPAVVVLLGATAAQSVLGPKFRVTRDRGTFLHVTDFAFDALVTIRASSRTISDADAARPHALPPVLPDHGNFRSFAD